MNQVKDAPKIQVQDTLSHLAIIYSIPDSNKILSVDFHAIMTPPWQKNYRIDWNFGDSTGIISKFDTSNLTHYYQKYGSYLVTLSVFDTVSKSVLGKTSASLNLVDNAIDTNFLHAFTKVRISFSYGDTMMGVLHQSNDIMPGIHWNGNYFELNASIGWNRGSYLTWDLNQGSEGFTLAGHVSYSGNRLDSGSFIYLYDHYYAPRIGFGGDHTATVLKYVSLPYEEKNLSELKYSYTGPELQSIITQYSDSSGGYLNLNNYSYHVYKNEILWSKQPPPTLTVTFSK